MALNESAKAVMKHIKTIRKVVVELQLYLMRPTSQLNY